MTVSRIGNMKPEMIAHVLQSLERELGRGRDKYSPDQTKKIRDALLPEPEKALETAYDWWMLNANYLPTPQKLIESVRSEAAKLRERSWGDEKKEYQKPIVADTKFAKSCKVIIMKFFPPEDEVVNYKDILEDAQAMAIRYPGSDWPNIYEEWKAQWQAR